MRELGAKGVAAKAEWTSSVVCSGEFVFGQTQNPNSMGIAETRAVRVMHYTQPLDVGDAFFFDIASFFEPNKG